MNTPKTESWAGLSKLWIIPDRFFFNQTEKAKNKSCAEAAVSLMVVEERMGEKRV